MNTLIDVSENRTRTENIFRYIIVLLSLGFLYSAWQMFQQFTFMQLLEEHYITLLVTGVALVIGVLFLFALIKDRTKKPNLDGTIELHSWFGAKGHLCKINRNINRFFLYVLIPYLVIRMFALLNGLFTSWIITTFHIKVEKVTQNQENLNQLANVNTDFLIYMFILTVLFAPIVEEVLFRYLAIGTKLQPKRWFYLRAVYSASLFTGLHVTGEFSDFLSAMDWKSFSILALSFIRYLIPAVVFTFVYVKTGKLRYSIGIHILNNAIAALVSYL